MQSLLSFTLLLFLFQKPCLFFNSWFWNKRDQPISKETNNEIKLNEGKGMEPTEMDS